MMRRQKRLTGASVASLVGGARGRGSGGRGTRASYLSDGLLAPGGTSSHVVHVACYASQIMALSIAKAGARYWD